MAKADQYGAIIRERYELGHPGNYGDSQAETARYALLTGNQSQIDALNIFETEVGYLRHPEVAGLWPESDTSNDQFVPWLMALELFMPMFAERVRKENKGSLKLKGSNAYLQLGSIALIYKSDLLLLLVNLLQGALLLLPWRIKDDGGIERHAGQVQDYLNLVCIHVYLKTRGRLSVLPCKKAVALAAVKRYYLEGPDAEPYSEFIVRAYEEALDNV